MLAAINQEDVDEGEADQARNAKDNINDFVVVHGPDVFWVGVAVGSEIVECA